MTELDAELGPLALEIIEEFGVTISYVFVGDEAVYNPATGTNEAPTSDPVDFKVAPPEEYNGVAIGASNGLIETGDKKLTASALSFTSQPTPEDRLKLGGEWYSVRQVQTVFSGELPCLYILQVRK
jgi:hypothetical protein